MKIYTRKICEMYVILILQQPKVSSLRRDIIYSEQKYLLEGTHIILAAFLCYAKVTTTQLFFVYNKTPQFWRIIVVLTSRAFKFKHEAPRRLQSVHKTCCADRQRPLRRFMPLFDIQQRAKSNCSSSPAVYYKRSANTTAAKEYLLVQGRPSSQAAYFGSSGNIHRKR